MFTKDLPAHSSVTTQTEAFDWLWKDSISQMVVTGNSTQHKTDQPPCEKEILCQEMAPGVMHIYV